MGMPRKCWAKCARRAAALLVAALALAAAPAAGSAQPTPASEDSAEERAKELFFEAKQLQEAGKPSEACAKFAESYGLSPRGAALQELAVCHAAEGRHATARAELSRVVKMAREADRPEAAREAELLLEAIEPKVSWLTVLLPARLAAIEKLYVTVNGSAVQRENWGKPIAVDPGEYLIEAQAPGWKPWSVRVAMRGHGDQQQVTVQLEALPPPAPPPVAPSFPALPPAHTQPPEEPADTLPYEEGEPIPPGYHVDTEIRTGLVVAGAITFSVMYLVTIVAGVSGGSSSSSTDPDDGVQLGDEGREPMYVPMAGPFITLGTADPNGSGAAFLILAGVTQVGGVALFVAGLAAPKTVLVRDEEGRARVRLTAELGPGAMGVGLTGAL